MAKKTTAHVFYRAQRRILADIDGDVLPYNVDNFAELHNYVDANVYLLDDQGDKDATMATLRTAVKELDLWLHERAAVIRARMLRSNPAPTKTALQVATRAQRRIIADMDNGIIPYDIDSFAVLRDYVGGNVYLLDDKGNQDVSTATLEEAADELEVWLMTRLLEIQDDPSFGKRGFSKKPAAVRRSEGLRDLKPATARKSVRGYGVRPNPVTMTRQRVTELRAEPTIDAATERLILDTARAMVRRGGLINKGMNEVIMLDGRPWTIQTDRIGDVIYAVLKHGRQSHYLVLSHPKR